MIRRAHTDTSTQKLSEPMWRNTNVGSTMHCLMKFRPTFFAVHRDRRNINDRFFSLCGFDEERKKFGFFVERQLSIRSHMWLWIDNSNLIWLSVRCVGKFDFQKDDDEEEKHLCCYHETIFSSLFIRVDVDLPLSHSHWNEFNNNRFTMTTVIKLYLKCCK